MHLDVISTLKVGPSSIITWQNRQSLTTWQLRPTQGPPVPHTRKACDLLACKYYVITDIHMCIDIIKKKANKKKNTHTHTPKYTVQQPNNILYCTFCNCNPTRGHGAPWNSSLADFLYASVSCPKLRLIEQRSVRCLHTVQLGYAVLRCAVL